MARYDKRTEYNKQLKKELKSKFKRLSWQVYADKPNTNGNYMFGPDFIFIACKSNKDTLAASIELHKAKKYVENLKNDSPFKISFSGE